MAEFPAKVSTEASSLPPRPAASLPSMLSRYVSMDLLFVRTIPAILMLAEIALGLLVWALISSTPYYLVPAYGWVMFVSVTLWLLTILLFVALFLGVHRKFNPLSWPLVMLVYNAAATVLYVTAFLADCASVRRFVQASDFNSLAASAFFSILVTVVYGFSTGFAFLTWRGEGDNAATSTIPA